MNTRGAVPFKARRRLMRGCRQMTLHTITEPAKTINCHFTAPATASVKLLCRMKNTMTVGSVQMVTPAMTTP